MKRILGYTDKLTVRPGELIDFKIDAEDGAQYHAQLVRLVNGDAHSTAANFEEIEVSSPINGTYTARRQLVLPGSCIVIDRPQPFAGLDAFSATLAFMPTTPRRGRQHLMSCWDQSVQAGWSLQIDDVGRLTCVVAQGPSGVNVAHLNPTLKQNRWYRAAIRVSWILRTLIVDCIPLTSAGLVGVDQNRRKAAQLSGDRPDNAPPLLIAAGFGGYTPSGKCIPVDSFNGRIEAPLMYQGLLTDTELGAVMSGGRPSALTSRLIGDWDFSVGIDSTMVTDRSVNGLHGYTHNLPLRGVKGSHWSGSEVNWRHVPGEYGAIHFHTDDLYDCGWQTDITYHVPNDLQSGIYALRLRLTDKAAHTVEQRHEEYLPFFVVAPKGAPRSDLAFLVPTYTYLAYGNVRAWDTERKTLGMSKAEYYASIWPNPGSCDYSEVLSEHPDLGSSTYDHHVDGSPVHTSSWLRPLLNLRPKSALWTFCADLLMTDWLEAKGMAYDIITDDLLQQEGVSLLKNYRVIMTGNHPEYQTTAQLDAIESYLGQGGRLMYMGGNGFYWRCAAHAHAPGVIEVRRGRTGTGLWMSDVGEDYLGFSGEMGGICRDIGRPPHRLVGVGFIAQGHDDAHYRILPEARCSRAAFLLNGIDGDIVGDFGIFGTAVGQEIDKTNLARGTPPHTIVVARSENHSPSMIYVIEEMNSVDPVIGHYQAQMYAEVVFFETPQGGAVFSVGSMAWCGSLRHNRYDNTVSRMTENAVKRFLDPLLFEAPVSQEF
jgi:N,N-dimethylformamidase